MLILQCIARCLETLCRNALRFQMVSAKHASDLTGRKRDRDRHLCRWSAGMREIV